MKYKVKDYEDIRQWVDGMTEEELLLSVTCPNMSHDQHVVYPGTSAVFFHTPALLEEHIEEYRAKCKVHPLIVADMEGAYVPMRATANSGEPKLAYEVGKHIGAQNAPLGFHWGLGPCVDITGNPDCPIVTARTPGRTVEENIAFGTEVIKGMQDYGIIATAKHFPGDGYCTYDQHLCTAVNPLPFDEWMETFGKSYKAFIECGLKSIMPGHISLPSYDDIDEKTGLHRPATLSKKLMVDLLRKELGFEGIIISDGVTMGGFYGYMNLYRACAESLEAGCDLLLFAIPNERFMKEMHKLIEEGVLTIDTLRDRAYRMWCFVREHTEEWEYTKHTLTEEEKTSLANELGEKAPCVERDRYNQLPLNIKKDSKVLINIINVDAPTNPFIDRIVENIKARVDDVDMLNDAGPEATIRQVNSKDYDAVICYIAPGMQGYGTNMARLSGPIARNMMGGWQRMGAPVVFITPSISIGAEYVSTIDMLINSNSSTQTTTADKIIEMIMGK